MHNVPSAATDALNQNRKINPSTNKSAKEDDQQKVVVEDGMMDTFYALRASAAPLTKKKSTITG